jgi:hypothetical protein
MGLEGVWKTTHRLTTHNVFFVTPTSDAKLTEALARGTPLPVFE